MSLNGWYHGRFDEHGELSPAILAQINEMKPPVVADDLASLLEADAARANALLDEADATQEVLARWLDEVVACYAGIRAMRHIISPEIAALLTGLVRRHYGRRVRHGQ